MVFTGCYISKNTGAWHVPHKRYTYTYYSEFISGFSLSIYPSVKSFNPNKKESGRSAGNCLLWGRRGISADCVCLVFLTAPFTYCGYVLVADPVLQTSYNFSGRAGIPCRSLRYGFSRLSTGFPVRYRAGTDAPHPPPPV